MLRSFFMKVKSHMTAVCSWVPKCCSTVVMQLLINAVMEHAMKKKLKLKRFLAFMLYVFTLGSWSLAVTSYCKWPIPT